MKKVILSLACILMICAAAIAAPKTKEIKTVVFDTSLHCENCVNKVFENISVEKGVKNLEISLEKQKIVVEYDAAKTSSEKLAAAIAKLGYKAEVHQCCSKENCGKESCSKENCCGCCDKK